MELRGKTPPGGRFKLNGNDRISPSAGFDNHPVNFFFLWEKPRGSEILGYDEWGGSFHIKRKKVF